MIKILVKGDLLIVYCLHKMIACFYVFEYITEHKHNPSISLGNKSILFSSENLFNLCIKEYGIDEKIHHALTI